MEWIADEHLDCDGMRCPIPIVKISRMMKNMPAGRTLSVKATDVAFRADLEAWVSVQGAELLRFEKLGEGQRALIRKLPPRGGE